MTIDAIYAIIIAALPAVSAIIGIIAAVVKMINNNKKAFQPIIDKYDELKKEIENKTNLDEARAEMKVIIQQNAQLRKQNAELIQVLNHVVVRDDEKI